jgi:hypothetical protein
LQRTASSHFTDEGQDLWQQDGEDDAAYSDRLAAYFDNLLVEADEEKQDVYVKEQQDFYSGLSMYNGLQDFTYKGSWGNTMLDFFFPVEGKFTDFAGDVKNFIGLTAALSDGQRASLDIISLRSMLLLGLGTEESVTQISEIFDKALGEEKPVLAFNPKQNSVYIRLASDCSVKCAINGTQQNCHKWHILFSFEASEKIKQPHASATHGAFFM